MNGQYIIYPRYSQMMEDWVHLSRESGSSEQSPAVGAPSLKDCDGYSAIWYRIIYMSALSACT